MAEIEKGPTFCREREIFLDALDRTPGEERARFIATATRGNEALKLAVEGLLAHHHADEFLENPATQFPKEAAGALQSSSDFAPDEKLGERIGRYKLLELIGEGGCGVVYLAEQQEPVRRRVALKVIKLGMDTRSVVARFEAERQALALMDHPNIARVLDAGATQIGRPYFVMELVQGVKITEYCQSNRLALPERIDLFLQLCQAIQHAHQKGIIHRDIKPSNVLVGFQDGTPVLKVIDFGIAKAIEEPLTDKTVLTNYHAFIGTPAYTSPEQAEMTGTDVDTRTDIYSLGVILYELLTGVTPFDGKELTRSGLAQMRRIIREREPDRPSARVLKGLAQPTPGKVPVEDRIDPDLDWIVMKCLEKDRARRYPTVQELGAELLRYRRNEPITARPPSRIYLFRKSLRRHRTPVLAGVAVFLALLVGVSLSTWQAIRATQAEHAADRSRAREVLLRQRAERERERAVESQRRAEVNEYVADINLAEQCIAAGNLARATDLLQKHSADAHLRGFEWQYLWRLAGGDERTIFCRESSPVLSLAVSHDAKTLAVGLRDSIHLYELPSGKILHRLPAAGVSLAFSPSGLLAGAGFRGAHLWRAADGSELFGLEHRSGPVSFSGDSRLLALASRSGVEILNTANGEEMMEFPGLFPPLAISAFGDRIVANSRDGLVVSTLAGDHRVPLESSKGRFFFGWLQERPVVGLSPDGRWVVAAQSGPGARFSLEVWDAVTGKHLDSIPSLREVPEHTGVISGLAFAADGRTLATSSWDHSLRLWNVPERRMIRTFLGSLSEVWSLALMPDGHHLLSGGKDGTVALWPIAERQPPLIPGEWRPLTFSTNGDVLVAVQGKTLGFFDVRTASLKHQTSPDVPDIRPRMGPPLEPVMSRDLRWAAFPTPTGARLVDLATSASTDFAAAEGRAEFLALSADANDLVVGRRRSTTFWWKRADPRKPVRELHADRVLFSAKGDRLFVVRSDEFEIWDVNSSSRITNHVVAESLGFSLALSPDGAVLAAGSNPEEIENEIVLLDTQTGKQIGVCAGHTQGVGRFAFAPDGRTLASSSTDGTLRLWNVRTQQQLLSLQPGPVADLLFAPDGSSLAVLTGRGPEAKVRFLGAAFSSSL